MPQPDGPTIAVKLPGSIARVAPETSTTGGVPDSPRERIDFLQQRITNAASTARKATAQTANWTAFVAGFVACTGKTMVA